MSSGKGAGSVQQMPHNVYMWMRISFQNWPGIQENWLNTIPDSRKPWWQRLWFNRSLVSGIANSWQHCCANASRLEISWSQSLDAFSPQLPGYHNKNFLRSYCWSDHSAEEYGAGGNHYHRRGRDAGSEYSVFRIRARFANKARNAARTCSVAACESLAGSCCLGNEAMWPDIPANLAIHPGRLGGFYATEAESSLFRL